MRALLDSNAYSLLMRGQEQVAEIVRTADELLFSAVVVGELLYGFRRGSRFEQNAADLRSFLTSAYSTFVDVGPVTADRYSRIAASLRAKGRPIPTNDVWIAAPRHGDRRRPRISRLALRTRRRHRLDSHPSKLTHRHRIRQLTNLAKTTTR